MDMTYEEALDFFAHLFQGDHHIPSEIRPHGSGWSINCHDRIATYDSNELTRLVVLAHDYCYRASIMQGGPKRLKIVIFKRQQEFTDVAIFHPTIEQAIALVRHNGDDNYGNVFGHNYRNPRCTIAPSQK